MLNKSFIGDNQISMQDVAAYDLINHGDHSQEDCKEPSAKTY